jgi:lysine 2,3-aminomutase
VAQKLRVPFDAGVRAAARRLPLRFPRTYVEELARAGALEHLRRIGWPAAEENGADPDGLADPVGERTVALDPLVLRKHPDRAILLVTTRCHFYCRFCFRAGERPEPTPADLSRAIERLRDEPDLREVILSGGDPLALDDGRIGALLAELGTLGQLETLRLHTRAPVHDPERVTGELVRLLVEAPRPVWVVVHVTHPAELGERFDGAIHRLRRAGVPLAAQAVLLAGVNDDLDLLEALMRGLYRRGIAPAYLHHPDRVAGTARFRLPLARGRDLVRVLRGRLPGPAVPAYVVDLPDGSGKVPVDWLEPAGPRRWQVRHPGGRISVYEDVE